MTIKEYEDFEEKQNDKTQKVILAMIALLAACHKDIEKELSDFYRKYGSDGVVTYQEARKWASGYDHRRRMMVIFMAISMLLGDCFAELYSAMDTHLRRLIRDEFKLHGLKLSDELLEKILKTKWANEYGESNWLPRLNAYEDRWRLILWRDLKTAFHTLNDVNDVMDDYNIRFRSMENLIKTLVITESTAVGTIARREIFKEMGVKKYKFYAREDERTCETCNALHGKIFPISAYEIGVTASPLHFRCRCWEVPIT